MYDCGRFKIGDGKDKRFEVRYRQDGDSQEEPFGWTDKEEAAESMAYAISEHPGWKGGRIIDRKEELSTCVDCGQWHDNPANERCNECQSWDEE